MIKIKISVIVPIYKNETTLERCVNSILNQSYIDMEIILVDDGSPDNSRYLCEMFAEEDKRIKVISKENGGVSSARNIGLEFATGEYISFVDADDWIEKDMIEALFNSIIETDADLSICNYYTEVSSQHYVVNRVCGKGRIFNSENALEFTLENLDMASIWNKLFCRKVISSNKIMFDENISIGEDLLFLCQYIFHSKRIAYNPWPKYHYVITNSSAMSSSFNLNKLSVIQAHYKIIAVLSTRYPMLVTTVNTRLINCCISLAIQHIQCDYKDKSLLFEFRRIITNTLISFVMSRKYPLKKKLYAVLISIHPCLFKFIWISINRIHQISKKNSKEE